MAKLRQVFVCKSCGAIQTRWMGKCPDCNAWDSLEPETVERAGKTDPRGAALKDWNTHGAPPGMPDPDNDDSPPSSLDGPQATDRLEALAARSPARPIDQISTDISIRRLSTGIGEFDRVLGGGIVPASTVLLGGDPGIGKSTLLLQAAASLAGRGARVLYVSSEESAEQVKLRASRLLGIDDRSAKAVGGNAQSSAALPSNIGGLIGSSLFVLSDTSLARIAEQAARVLSDAPADQRVLIVDSIQMIYKADLDAFPGSMTQLRRCCAELVYMAKATGTAVILVGHVTKDGALAGPRLLEHLVDAVLYFEGDRYHSHRIVRAVKNRYGSTLELGLFEMTGQGLRQAPDGVAVATFEPGVPGRPGTVVCPVQTGTRCLLVEIQALTATGFLGAAKRKSSGLDSNRLAMLIAVLEQHAGLRLADRDIFASAVGGVRIAEPAADLALLLAIAGAHNRRGLPASAAVVGEVGLGGEIRPVAQLEARIHEAARLGCKLMLVPKSRARTAGALAAQAAKDGVQIIPVATIAQAMDHLAPVPSAPKQPQPVAGQH